MTGTVHLIKLCVGTDTVEQLAEWQKTPRNPSADGLHRHVTRMWPKRAAEVVNGGSLYWVIRGQVLCRQRILRLDEVIGADGITRCGLVLESTLHRTQAALRRPFQGWRYLAQQDAPPDLPASRASDDALPDDLNRALAEIGVF